MVVRKHRKVTKRRGSKTHGWGSMKKHRGAGDRGGRGMAGTGKRADQKKPSIWAEDYFGKYGFIKKNAREAMKPVSILYLEQHAGRLLDKGILKKEGEVYAIVLEDLGCNKLLSQGKATKKYKITASYASQKAIEKIKALQGEVIGLQEPEAP